MFENWNEHSVVTAVTRHIVKSQVGGGPVTGQHAGPAGPGLYQR
jgi:hypothetical protein